MQTIQRGDTGPAVDRLHQDLIEQGFEIGSDGKDHTFGRDTFNAVCMFQASHIGSTGETLRVDGIVGDDTRWALENPSREHQDGKAYDVVDQLIPGIAGRALHAAVGELKRNVREEPDGSNRGERIDLYTNTPPVRVGRGEPWCALFVSWCVNQATQGKSPFGTIALAQNLIHWARRNSCALIPGAAILRPGDIFVIARDDVHGHCGFLRQVTPGQGGALFTVEGNSGNAVRSLRRKASEFTTIVRLPDPS